MPGEIRLHDVEREELMETLNQWLDDRRKSSRNLNLDQEIVQLERLLHALRSGGSLSAGDSDLLLLVMDREIRRLQKLTANPDSYLAPAAPPPVSGLFKGFKLRRAAKEQALARDDVLRSLRRELGWLELLAAKMRALKSQST
jgi:hypothetical protein